VVKIGDNKMVVLEDVCYEAIAPPKPIGTKYPGDTGPSQPPINEVILLDVCYTNYRWKTPKEVPYKKFPRFAPFLDDYLV